jgi:hypothetical protein
VPLVCFINYNGRKYHFTRHGSSGEQLQVMEVHLCNGVYAGYIIQSNSITGNKSSDGTGIGSYKSTDRVSSNSTYYVSLCHK